MVLLVTIHMGGDKNIAALLRIRTNRTRYPLAARKIEVEIMVLLVTVRTERDKKSPRFYSETCLSICAISLLSSQPYYF